MNTPSRLFSCLIYTAFLALLVSFSAQGQTLYWDANGPNPSSPSSTGNFEDSNWSADSDGLVFPTGWSNDADYVFSATGYTGTQTVTLTNSPDFANSFTFNQGTVTLLGSSASLTVGNVNNPSAPSILDTSDDGPVTFDSSLGTVLLNNAGPFFPNIIIENDSTQNLIFNSNLSSSTSGSIFTFTGTGTGSTVINGQINLSSGGVGIDDESATSALFLNGSNNSVNGLTVNGGTVSALNNSSIGGSAITLKNGGTLTFESGTNVGQNVNVTGGGTINFGGDSALQWSAGQVNADTLTFGAGDALDVSSGSQNIGTLDLTGVTGVFSRLIVGIGGGGVGLVNGISQINVSNGYILDFGSSGTVTSPINFASGTSLVARNNVTVTLPNASLPIGGTWSVGNDDVGSNDTFILPTAYNLTGTTTINLLGGGVSTHLTGDLTGTGGLTFSAPARTGYGGGEGIVYLDGTNSYSGATVLGPLVSGAQTFPVVEINGNSSGIGNTINVESGILVLGPSAQLPTGSVISIGNPSSNQNSDNNVALQIGNGSATNVTVYDVVATSNWNNPNDRAADQITGNSAGATLTWDVEGSATNDTFQGHIGDGSTNGNNITIVKTGAGTLTLTGSSQYTGGTTVNAGTLAIFGGNNFGADQSAVGATSLGNNNYGAPVITMNNGSTLVDLNNGLGVTVNFNTPGTVTIDGDTLSIAGQLAVSGDEFISGQFIGGGGMAFTGGDALVALSATSTAGNLYVENSGTRVLMLNNSLIAGTGYSITVGNGADLDFGMGGSPVTSVPIIMENGSSLSDRGTNATISDLIITPAASGTTSITLGTDDVSGGSLTVLNNVVVAPNTQIIGFERDNGFTGVNFAGGFSGTGNITFDTAQLISNFNSFNRGTIQVSGTSTYKGDTTVNGGILDLTGDNTGVTSATGGAPTYRIVDTGKPYIDGNNNPQIYSTPGILQVGAGGSLASNAKVVVGGAPGFAYFVLGDNSGAVNVTVGNISVDQSGGSNDNGAILGGASSNSTLTVDVAASTTDTYQGIFGDARGYNFNDNTTDGNINNNQRNLGVVFNIGTGGTMELSGFNSGNVAIAGGFIANGGTLLIDGNAGALGTSNVTLNNTTMVVANNDYNGSPTNPHVIIGTGTNSLNAADGIDNFSGDIQSGAGSVIHVSGSNFVFTPDGTASTIGTLDIDGGRIFLMNPSGLNLIANNTTVNVSNNAVLDFATDTTSTLNNAFTFTSGTGLTTRNNSGTPTNITLTNVLLPTAGSFTVGSDDVGDNGGSFTITSNLALTGDLALHVVGNSFVPVTLSGNISGNGGISEDNGSGGPGNLYLTGTNTYSGQTSAIFANLFIDGNNSGAGANYFSNFSTITIGHGGSIASNANLLFGNGGGFGTFVLGDGNGTVSQTVGALVMESSGTSLIYNGNTLNSDNSVLTVNNTAADTYTGILGNNSTTNGNNLALVKSGAGTLTLTGANTYTGGTTVNGGKLAVNGSIAGGATVNLGGAIGGSGKINGAIGGAGAVSLGDPTILTATSVDPTSGMSFNLEFTLSGQPNYGNAASSGNDVLHLEGGTPFTAALTSSNVINFYLSGNGTFDGGIFINGDTDTLTANLANATENFYVLNNVGGTVSYDGNDYSLVSSLGGTASESTFAATGAGFADSTTDGFEEQITVSGAVIPEPSTYALMGLAGLTLLFVRRRLKS